VNKFEQDVAELVASMNRLAVGLNDVVVSYGIYEGNDIAQLIFTSRGNMINRIIDRDTIGCYHPAGWLARLRDAYEARFGNV